MKAFLLIGILISSTVLSCGISDPDDSVRVFDIVEINDRATQDWIDYVHANEIEGFDWPERIELADYKKDQIIKGRVKMHYLGWLPIEDISIDGNVHFKVLIDDDEVFLLSSVNFLWNAIDNNQIVGIFMYHGPTFDDSLANPYRATR